MTFDNIRLDKGLYGTTKSFTQALEGIDPSENYKGTNLEGLDAYQRQLKRFDIKVSGKNSDSIEKFFRTSDSAALFPEYVSRAVAQGMQEADLVSKITATTTVIDSLDYRPLSCPDNINAAAVSEDETITEVKLTTQSNLIPLTKRGSILSASYEAIKHQRLDLFTVTLKQIGAAIAKAQLNDALETIIFGDGNNNPAATSKTAANGTITYADLVNFWNSFTDFNLTTIVASPDVVAAILKLAEFRDVYTGLDFHSAGKIVTPFGAELYKSSSLANGTLIGLDKNCALEKIQAGSIVTEYDKLIDRQLDRAAITAVAGFAKIYKDASKKLTLA